MGSNETNILIIWPIAYQSYKRILQYLSHRLLNELGSTIKILNPEWEGMKDPFFSKEDRLMLQLVLSHFSFFRMQFKYLFRLGGVRPLMSRLGVGEANFFRNRLSDPKYAPCFRSGGQMLVLLIVASSSIAGVQILFFMNALDRRTGPS